MTPLTAKVAIILNLTTCFGNIGVAVMGRDRWVSLFNWLVTGLCLASSVLCALDYLKGIQ